MKLNATGLEQVKAIGNKVVSDSTTEERLKVEKQLIKLTAGKLFLMNATL